MNRRKALKIAAGASLGVAATGVGGFELLKKWANPQTPLHYPFPPLPRVRAESMPP
jgi:hypothetical protein